MLRLINGVIRITDYTFFYPRALNGRLHLERMERRGVLGPAPPRPGGITGVRVKRAPGAATGLILSLVHSATFGQASGAGSGVDRREPAVGGAAGVFSTI